MLDHNYQAKLREQAYGNSKQIIDDELNMVNEYEFDLDNIKPSIHRWVKRGCVLSCEGAGHPNHRHFIKERNSTVSTN